ncbi:MAG: T9SS type A sorting domain-containing protein [Candidatus Eisenbacteria bacterium]|nr:T9SS type A sorting domain-containing protein [Candidatus Eisenbacteria bacterium]
MRKIARLVLIPLALLATAGASTVDAANWSLSLNSPSQSAGPGVTTVFDGTISNGSGGPLEIDAGLGFTLAPETDLFTLDFAPEFAALNLVLPAGGYTGPLFTVSWSTGVLPGTLGQGEFQLAALPPGDPGALTAPFAVHVPGIGVFCKEPTPFLAAHASISPDDSLGTPVMAYNVASEGSIRYARVVSHAWVQELVLNGVGASAAPSLVLDGGRKPRVAYYKTPTGDLGYSEKTGTSWVSVVIDATGDVGVAPSLAVDTGGGVHISYYDATSQDLKYAYRPFGGSWSTATVDAGGAVGRHSSVAVDELGSPFISYYDETNGDLKCAHREGAVWVSEIVDAVGTTGTHTSIEVAGGMVQISYRDETSGSRSLRLATGSPGAWTSETVDSAGDPGFSTSLELDAFGQPRIAYRDGASNAGKYAAKTEGFGWEIGTIDAPANTFLSMAMRETGDPLILYGGTGSALRYASFGTCTTVAVEEGGTGIPALSLEPNRPNPFAPETTIAFALGRASRTAVRIFDVVGRQVAVPFDQNAGPGMHRVTWDGRSQEGNRLPSGIYMYEVRTETAVRRGRMVMLH